MEAKRNAMMNHVRLLQEMKINGKLTTLYQLHDIKNVREWNYELPTLTQKGRFLARKPWAASEEFRNAFISAYPIFQDLNMSNIAIMGGSIFDVLHGKCGSKDIDLFLCGEIYSEESAKAQGKTVEEVINERVLTFIKDIEQYFKDRAAKEAKYRPDKSNREKHEKTLISTWMNGFQASRNGSVITFSIPNLSVPIQLVLAPNVTLTDLLSRADIDITAIAYYNKEIYFNGISKFCYENACMLYNPTHTKRYEERLVKYFTLKEVDLILPHLDLTKVPSKNLKYNVEEVIDLNYLAVVYNQISGQKVLVSRIIPTTPLSNEDDEEDDDDEDEDEGVEAGAEKEGNKKGSKGSAIRSASSGGGGYGNEEEGVSAVQNAGQIIHENIIHLNHDLPERFQFYGEGKYVKDVLLSIPKLTDRMITNTFETIRDRLLDPTNDDKLDIKLLENFFTIKNISDIVMDILVKKLESKEKKVAAKGLKKVSLFTENYTFCLKQYFDQLVADQIQLTNSKLEALEQDFKAHPEKYEVIAKRPFEVDTIDVKEWYSERYWIDRYAALPEDLLQQTEALIIKVDAHDKEEEVDEAEAGEGEEGSDDVEEEKPNNADY